MANGFESNLGPVKALDVKAHDDSTHRQPLDSVAVYGDNHEAGSFCAAPEGQSFDHLIASSDQVTAAIRHHMTRIADKFNSLPVEQRQQMVASFAPHMTGEDYPLYDHLRNSLRSV